MFKCQTQEGNRIELQPQFVQGAYLPAITRCNQYLTTSPDADVPTPIPVFYHAFYELKYVSHDLNSVVVSINKSISFFTATTDHVFLKDIDTNNAVPVIIYYDGTHIKLTLEDGYLDSTYLVLLSGIRDVEGNPLPSISSLPFVARIDFSVATIVVDVAIAAIPIVIRQSNALVASKSKLEATAIANRQTDATIGVSFSLEATVEPDADISTALEAIATVNRKADAIATIFSIVDAIADLI